MQPISENQRNMSDSYCACHAKCIFADPLQMSHACHRFWECYRALTFRSFLAGCTISGACHAKQLLNVYGTVGFQHFDFWRQSVLRATTACTFPKVLREWCVLCILTSKCGSHRNGVHFFNSSTSKSGLRPSFFNF